MTTMGKKPGPKSDRQNTPLRRAGEKIGGMFKAIGRVGSWVAFSGVVPLLMAACVLWLAAGQEADSESAAQQLPATAFATNLEKAAALSQPLTALQRFEGQSAVIPITLNPAGEGRLSSLRLTEVENAPDLASAAKAYARERNCLAQAIYFEARGESIMGQTAVAEVVLNRVADPRYPKTICGTVFQNMQLKNRCQFSFACDDIADRTVNVEAWHTANRLADQFLLGLSRHSFTGSATHYHADYVMPYWAPTLVRVTKIGQHVFYRIPARSSYGRQG